MTAGRPDQDAAGLLELIDQLEGLLNKSELSELEIEAGQTALVLRKPVAIGRGGESAESAAPGPAQGSAVSDAAAATASDEGQPPFRTATR